MTDFHQAAGAKLAARLYTSKRIRTPDSTYAHQDQLSRGDVVSPCDVKWRTTARMSAGTDRIPAHFSRCMVQRHFLIHDNPAERSLQAGSCAHVAAYGTNVSFRTNAESDSELSRRESHVPADNLSPNDVDRVMQSCPRRQVEEERAAGAFGEFKLNPRVESIDMNADHARCPPTIAGSKRSLIECGEPAVSYSHLVVQSERPWHC